MNNDAVLRATTDVSQAFNSNTPFDGSAERVKQPNRFLSVLKGIGVTAAPFIPGVGGAIAGLLSGGGPNMGTMQAMLQQQQRSSMQMLALQQQVSTQSQEFTAVSNLLKSRHDSESTAVQNLKS